MDGCLFVLLIPAYSLRAEFPNTWIIIAVMDGSFD